MTEPATDLERFFRQMVRNLASTDPARLHRPLPLADIRDSIVPYRVNRRALQLESSEDYELVLLQLCAGEGGFARTEPDDVRALFAAELRSSNPDLAILHQHENAVVSLETQPLVQALSPKPELAFAPPGHANDPAAPETPRTDLPDLSSFEPLDAGPPAEPHASRFMSHCAQCGGLLPSGRVVNFCPHCGGHHVLARCPACRSEVEVGWRHCISCGATLSAH
jgi:hypothetical protein